MEWQDIQVKYYYIPATNIYLKQIKYVRLHPHNFLRLENLKPCFKII